MNDARSTAEHNANIWIVLVYSVASHHDPWGIDVLELKREQGWCIGCHTLLPRDFKQLESVQGGGGFGELCPADQFGLQAPLSLVYACRNGGVLPTVFLLDLVQHRTAGPGSP